MSEDANQHDAFPELVFGLVGPIGVNIDAVQDCLVSALKQVDYNTETVHISKLVRDQQKSISPPGQDTTLLEQKIREANAFCAEAEDASALAGLAVLAIMQMRSSKNLIQQGEKDLSEQDTGSKPIPKQAYVIKQLKRSAEVNSLRQVYGQKFIQISISLDKPARVRRLTDRILRDHPSYDEAKCERHARRLVEIDENERDATHTDGNNYGQEVGEIFHTGEFFIDTSDQSKIEEKVTRFIKALFGNNYISPTKDEFGAYMAAAAALRSADLSRQVGSAIFTPQGDVVTVGCNEVPRSGGGNYWYEDDDKHRDIEMGAEQNSIEKQRIITDFLSKLKGTGLVSENFQLDSIATNQELAAAIDDALISDITEYGRMTHAEMSAICDAARLGRPLEGTTIYVTTFPCHNCAKHIVAAGISRVVYIEPYPKSKAERSHPDSIVMDTPVASKVCFEHFEGIAPIRYLSIFKKGRRRRGKTIQTWYHGDKRPMIAELDFSHINRERHMAALSLKKIRSKADNTRR